MCLRTRALIRLSNNECDRVGSPEVIDERVVVDEGGGDEPGVSSCQVRLCGGTIRQTKGKEQFWEGKLVVRPGFEIRLVVRASVKNGAEPVATLDSPDENLSGLKLSSVVLDASRLAFELKVTDAKFDGKMNAAKTEAKGNWTQRGATLPLTFVKRDKVAPMPMPVGKEQLWEGKLSVGAGLSLRTGASRSENEGRRPPRQARQPRPRGQRDARQLSRRSMRPSSPSS